MDNAVDVYHRQGSSCKARGTPLSDFRWRANPWPANVFGTASDGDTTGGVVPEMSGGASVTYVSPHMVDRMTLCGSEVPQDRWRGRTAGSGMWTLYRESAIMEPLRRLRHPLRLISAYSPREPTKQSVSQPWGAPKGAPTGTPKMGPQGGSPRIWPNPGL